MNEKTISTIRGMERRLHMKSIWNDDDDNDNSTNNKIQVNVIKSKSSEQKEAQATHTNKRLNKIKVKLNIRISHNALLSRNSIRSTCCNSGESVCLFKIRYDQSNRQWQKMRAYVHSLHCTQYVFEKIKNSNSIVCKATIT